MNKLLLALPLLLTGCFHATWNDPLPPESPPPVVIASGTNGDVIWRCQLTQWRADQAQAECEFKNRQLRAVPEACIRIDFYAESDGHLITQSNPLCSGILPATGTSTAYVDFTEEDRATLQGCGKDLQYCVMLVGAR